MRGCGRCTAVFGCCGLLHPLAWHAACNGLPARDGAKGPGFRRSGAGQFQGAVKAVRSSDGSVIGPKSNTRRLGERERPKHENMVRVGDPSRPIKLTNAV